MTTNNLQGIPLTLSGLSVPHGSAVISACGKYRYELWRHWDDKPYCMFVGLNPSTADAMIDDPTIRRCVGFAKAWGYGALCMANLFAWRATDPKDMKAAPEPIGPDNDATLQRLAVGAGIVIAAWGAHGSYRGRAVQVLAILPTLHALKLTQDGSPGHPLYLRGDARPFLLNATVSQCRTPDDKDGRT